MTYSRRTCMALAALASLGLAASVQAETTAPDDTILIVVGEASPDEARLIALSNETGVITGDEIGFQPLLVITLGEPIDTKIIEPAMPDELLAAKPIIHPTSMKLAECWGGIIGKSPGDGGMKYPVGWIKVAGIEDTVLPPGRITEPARKTAPTYLSLLPDTTPGVSQARLGDGGQAGLRLAARFGGSGAETPQVILLA